MFSLVDPSFSRSSVTPCQWIAYSSRQGLLSSPQDAFFLLNTGAFPVKDWPVAFLCCQFPTCNMGRWVLDTALSHRGLGRGSEYKTLVLCTLINHHRSVPYPLKWGTKCFLNERAFSVCSLCWMWRCAAQTLFQDWRSDAPSCWAGRWPALLSASFGLSQMRTASTRPRPFRGSYIQWLNDEGVERPGCPTQLGKCWKVSPSSVHLQNSPEPPLRCPLKLYCGPASHSAQFCFLPFPSTSVGSQKHSLKIPCTLVPDSELASWGNPSHNIYEIM